MTTHDPGGGGRPRLIFAFGGTAPEHDSQRELDLLPGVTVIGSLGPIFEPLDDTQAALASMRGRISGSIVGSRHRVLPT